MPENSAPHLLLVPPPPYRKSTLPRRVSIRFGEKEAGFDVVYAAAKSLGLSVSTYMRESLIRCAHEDLHAAMESNAILRARVELICEGNAVPNRVKGPRRMSREVA